MRIKVAKRIGFCFGVKRAVDIANSALSKGGEFFCLGPLIHNPQQVGQLSKKGLKIVKNVKDIKKGSVLVIRSHGLLPQLINSAKRRGIKLVDATCLFVKKAQNICRALVKDGFEIIVVGDKKHPEVKALVAFADGEAKVVQTLADLENLRLRKKKIGIVAQTTQSKKDFYKIISAFLGKFNHRFSFEELRIFDTICADSATRQKEAREISGHCDVMLVIGGKNSANSRRLVKICRENTLRAYHIETEKDLRSSWFAKNSITGIVSGASTPDWIIKNVVQKVKEK